MLKVLISKLLIVAFVGSVTLWYIFTPYLVQPHKRIMNDLLTQSSLTQYHPSQTSNNDGSVLVNIENWTKWRLYVETDDSTSNQVIYGSSAKPILLKNKAVIQMEWRSEYRVVIEVTPEVTARIEVPMLSFNHWGIYDHFIVSVEDGTVKIVPRFLFGIPLKTVEAMYGPPEPGHPDRLGPNLTEDIVGRLPIIGLFSSSNAYDRVIIQIYMTVVLCSVIFLLLVNNPPESFNTATKKEEESLVSSNNCTQNAKAVKSQ